MEKCLKVDLIIEKELWQAPFYNKVSIWVRTCLKVIDVLTPCKEMNIILVSTP